MEVPGQWRCPDNGGAWIIEVPLYYSSSFFMYCYIVTRDDTVIFSPPETTSQNYVLVEFHCLLSIHQWGLDDSSNVYICFAAKELGEFKFCYGPMLPIKRLVGFCFCYIYYCNTVIVIVTV